MNMKDFMKTAKKVADQKSPAILAGLALVGLAATAISAYKAGPKAKKILKEKRKDMECVRPGDKAAKRAVVMETVKEMVPVMAPTIIMGSATAACIIGSHKESSRRIAVLSAAYSASEKVVKDLNGKMNEMLGESKTKLIKDAIVKDGLKEDAKKGVPTDNQIIITGNGDVLCKDVYTGRYFKSNAQKIGEAINKLSHRVRNEMYVSLNDFYDLLGIPMVPMGEDLGWNVDDCYDGQIPITFTAQLTEDQQPCLCVEYDISVRADFRRLS